MKHKKQNRKEGEDFEDSDNEDSTNDSQERNSMGQSESLLQQPYSPAAVNPQAHLHTETADNEEIDVVADSN